MPVRRRAARFAWLLLSIVAAGLWPGAAPPRLAAEPMLVVELPAGSSAISGRVVISGWAVEIGADGDRPVDDVSIWLDGGPAGAGTLLGHADYGLPRPDVADSLGDPALAPTGFRFVWDSSPLSAAPGPRRFVVAARSEHRWAEVGLDLVVVPGPDPDPGLEPAGDLPAATRTTVEGLDFQTLSLPGLTVTYDDRVSGDRLRAAIGALDHATTRVPEALGLPRPSAPTRLYLFGDQTTYLQGTARLQGVTVDQVGSYTQGHTYAEPARYPGIFCNAAVGDDPGALAHLLTHEYVHQVVRAATRGQPVGQWFDEGLADATAYAVLRPFYPENEHRRYAAWLSEVARAAARGGLVALRELDSGATFTRLGNAGRGDLLYGESLLAVDQLARRGGLRPLAALLPAVGAGRRWPEAFRAATGVPLEQVFAEFTTTVGNVYPAVVPSAGTAAARFFCVLTGFRDGERWLMRVLRPDGTRTEPEPGVATGGVVVLSVAVPPGALPGAWTVEVSGDAGSRGTVGFTVVPDAP